MKRITILMLVAMFAATTLRANAPADKKDFVGDWKFTSQYAPEGFQTGTFVIGEKEGALTGEIRFAEGYTVPMKNMVVTDGVLKFSISVDYNDVPITATVEGNKLKGTASSPEGNLPFEAVKVVKEQ
jgi:hypothetical protein